MNHAIGGQLAFLLAAFLKDEEGTVIFVANDKEEAAYMQNTLASILDSKRIYFFSDSFKRPMKFEEIDNHNMVQRTEIVNKITGSGAGNQAVITYPEAVFEKVVDPSVLEKSRIKIKENEKFDVDTIIEVLLEYGFERSDFVYEPGFFLLGAALWISFLLAMNGHIELTYTTMR